MTTITTHDAKTHLSHYLAEVEKSEQFIIARGKKAVAMLTPLKPEPKRPRPKVGDIKGEPFEFPDAAIAPLTDEELKQWGLDEAPLGHLCFSLDVTTARHALKRGGGAH